MYGAGGTVQVVRGRLASAAKGSMAARVRRRRSGVPLGRVRVGPPDFVRRSLGKTLQGQLSRVVGDSSAAAFPAAIDADTPQGRRDDAHMQCSADQRLQADLLLYK